MLKLINSLIPQGSTISLPFSIIPSATNVVIQLINTIEHNNILEMMMCIQLLKKNKITLTPSCKLN